jgi:rRNA biogenesis protein RRP5
MNNVHSVDREQKKVEMTFRSGDLERGKSSSLSLADLHEGQKVDGRIKRVEAYGLFIEIEGSKLSGLCHKSEVSNSLRAGANHSNNLPRQLSDNRDADVTVALRGFQEGDRVKVVILLIDKEKRQMSLGLKPSYFADEDFAAHSEDGTDGQEETGERFGTVDEENGKDMTDVVVPDSSGSEDKGSEDSEDNEADQIHVDATIQSHPFGHASPTHGPLKVSIVKPPVPSLKIAGGFQWSGNGTPSEEEVPSESSSGESDSCEQTGRKKKRRRKEIEQDLTAAMHSRTPASNADFERLLLGSPNSSYLWIQYMSFQLQLSEVEKARELGQRALKTINFREEQEKLNVWIGLLNLENVYGTDETMNTTFKEAVRHNESKAVHLHLASIFDQTEKHQVR